MNIKDVRGLLTTNDGYYFTTVTVRVTRDEKGCPLSLAQEEMGIQLSVAYEDIADMLEVEDGA